MPVLLTINNFWITTLYHTLSHYFAFLHIILHFITLYFTLPHFYYII